MSFGVEQYGDGGRHLKFEDSFACREKVVSLQSKKMHAASSEGNGLPDKMKLAQEKLVKAGARFSIIRLIHYITMLCNATKLT